MSLENKGKVGVFVREEKSMQVIKKESPMASSVLEGLASSDWPAVDITV